jgi:hypothetical protein
MRQKPDRAKKMFVTTCSMMNVTGHSAPPTAGTTLMGSAIATMTRITASARMASVLTAGITPPATRASHTLPPAARTP